MKQHREILKSLEKKHAASLLKKHALVCKNLGYGADSSVLYIAKPHWTNRFDAKRESTIGIFCSIWVSPELLNRSQFAYNIHSKQIRKLPGYKLTSIEFAKKFRDAVRSAVVDWPGISLDYGPTNLLEGRDNGDLDVFAENVEKRIDGFVSIHKKIDQLLDEPKN